MIYKQSLLGSLGNAAQDAYNQTYYSTGSASQSEAAARNATPAQVYIAPPPAVINTPAPVVTAPVQPAQPTQQTIQPVTNTAEVVSAPPPAIVSKVAAPVVNPLIPNVTYGAESSQYSLTQTAAGAGLDVPPEYLNQDVVATPDAPAVSSASIPWGLLLSLAGAAYESFKK